VLAHARRSRPLVASALAAGAGLALLVKAAVDQVGDVQVGELEERALPGRGGVDVPVDHDRAARRAGKRTPVPPPDLRRVGPGSS
jgi:hypothetical protein